MGSGHETNIIYEALCLSLHYALQRSSLLTYLPSFTIMSTCIPIKRVLLYLYPYFKFMHIHLFEYPPTRRRNFLLYFYLPSLYVYPPFLISTNKKFYFTFIYPHFKFLYIHHFDYPPRGNFYFTYIYPHFKFRYNLSIHQEEIFLYLSSFMCIHHTYVPTRNFK